MTAAEDVAALRRAADLLDQHRCAGARTLADRIEREQAEAADPPMVEGQWRELGRDVFRRRSGLLVAPWADVTGLIRSLTDEQMRGCRVLTRADLLARKGLLPDDEAAVDSFDTAKVGDDFPYDGGVECGDWHDGWVCTRPPHTTGQHVASDESKVLAVWPRKSEPRVIRKGDPEPEVGPTIWVDRDGGEWRHDKDGWVLSSDVASSGWSVPVDDPDPWAKVVGPYLPLTEQIDTDYTGPDRLDDGDPLPPVGWIGVTVEGSQWSATGYAGNLAEVGRLYRHDSGNDWTTWTGTYRWRRRGGGAPRPLVRATPEQIAALGLDDQ